MKVSVVIPVYNEFRLFNQVLDRVSAASLPPGCSKEIIVVDDVDPIVGVCPIVLCDMVDDLQPQRSLATSFFSEHNRCCGMGWIAIDLVPRRMKCAVSA